MLKGFFFSETHTNLKGIVALTDLLEGDDWQIGCSCWFRTLWLTAGDSSPAFSFFFIFPSSSSSLLHHCSASASLHAVFALQCHFLPFPLIIFSFFFHCHLTFCPSFSFSFFGWPLLFLHFLGSISTSLLFSCFPHSVSLPQGDVGENEPTFFFFFFESSESVN